MAKSFVLQALRIFSLEEMLKLSKDATKAVSMKKAAGAESIVWDGASAESELSRTEADILPFKKNSFIPGEINEPISDPNQVTKPSEESGNFHSSEFMLWQRELSKETGGTSKKDAVKGYAKATEMYVVKPPAVEGKEKIRFAATNGVLVNKKQA